MRARGLVLIPAVAALAAGCGGSGGSESAGSGTATTAAGGVKACLVSDVGRFNDKGFNQLQLTGLQHAAAQLHIRTRALESHAAGDYVPNLSSCARQGYDITIAAGFLLADPLATVAKQFPNQHFAITDYSTAGAPFNGNQSPNVEGLTYATQENGYLVGCMAALMAKQQGGKQVIGAVGGVKIPPVDTYIAGYRFNVAGACGLGALQAAKARRVWGIGVDTDQSFLGPFILTSAVKRVDQGVYLTIKDVEEDSFEGGRDLVFDLKNGGVGLGKTSPKVPKSILRQIDRLKEQIIAGTITPPATVKSG